VSDHHPQANEPDPWDDRGFSPHGERALEPDPVWFHHEALLYENEREYAEGVGEFIREGVEAGEPVMVAVDPHKTALLRRELGSLAERVRFVEMRSLGANPGRIISAWRQFAKEYPGPIRGVGEPVWPGRTEDERGECYQHEALLNLAFRRRTQFRLLCPYDAASLHPDTIAAAHETHPVVTERGEPTASAVYVEPSPLPLPPHDLSQPPEDATGIAIEPGSLAALRRVVAAEAERHGMSDERVWDTVTAVHELAMNSVLHGGGRGVLRMWRTGHAMVCEVQDSGLIESALIGRTRPDPMSTSGRGMWIVNQLCDLVQVRSWKHGTTVRVTMAIRH
jgi:anti-sigma regulatory factor (Ser/Thr protein kinase)